jgi:hypothetical protein
MGGGPHRDRQEAYFKKGDQKGTEMQVKQYKEIKDRERRDNLIKNIFLGGSISSNESALEGFPLCHDERVLKV